MMDLFDYSVSLPYAKGSPTSKSGALAARSNASGQNAIVLAEIKQSGKYGATMKELKEMTGIKESSTMSRILNTLKNRGLIFDSGRERPGASKAMQAVYVVFNNNGIG
jgi:predicted HTH transcriptional regulator